MKSEQSCLWISRASFLLSAAALASFGYRTLSEHNPTAAVIDSAVLDSAGPISVPFDQGASLSGSALRTVQPSLGAVEDAFVSPPSATPLAGEDWEPPLEPSSEEVLSDSQAPVRVKRLVVTGAVEDREPVEVDDVVSGDAPVFAFVELTTGRGTEQEVVVSFEHEAGNHSGVVNLSVPANQKRWRTWGRTRRIDRDGRWTAVVRDRSGAVLGRTEFTVRSTSS